MRRICRGLRSWRIPIIGSATVVMLAASTFAIVAQSAPATPDPMAPSVVAGTLTDGREESAGTTTRIEGVDQRLGLVYRNVWDFDDPRLDGQVTYNGNWSSVPFLIGSNPFTMQVESAIYQATNPGGRWMGTATACCAVGPIGIDTVVLAGTGGYEGLTAYLVLDWTEQPPLFQGVIFPGPMPPAPSLAPAAPPSK